MKSRTLSATSLILLAPMIVLAFQVQADQVRVYDTADGKLLREFAEGTTPINLYYKIFEPETVSSRFVATSSFKGVVKNIKMTLDGEEFELPGWVRGQLKNVVGMVGS